MPAQAVWLDAERLHWAGQPASGRYRLLHSAKGGLVAEPGQPAQGFERSLALQPAAPLSTGAAQRWRYLQGGALLALSEPLARGDAILLQRGELLLVLLDAQDRVLARTRLQSPGTLDALFASAAEPLSFGVQTDASGTQGRLWAPTARAVEVCLFPSATAAPSERLPARFQHRFAKRTARHNHVGAGERSFLAALIFNSLIPFYVQPQTTTTRAATRRIATISGHFNMFKHGQGRQNFSRTGGLAISTTEITGIVKCHAGPNLGR